MEVAGKLCGLNKVLQLGRTIATKSWGLKRDSVKRGSTFHFVGADVRASGPFLGFKEDSMESAWILNFARGRIFKERG